MRKLISSNFLFLFICISCCQILQRKSIKDNSFSLNSACQSVRLLSTCRIFILIYLCPINWKGIVLWLEEHETIIMKIASFSLPMLQDPTPLYSALLYSSVGFSLVFPNLKFLICYTTLLCQFSLLATHIVG